MVKILLQFAIKLLSDDADPEFVSWCGSMYIRFQNFCTTFELLTIAGHFLTFLSIVLYLVD